MARAERETQNSLIACENWRFHGCKRLLNRGLQAVGKSDDFVPRVFRRILCLC